MRTEEKNILRAFLNTLRGVCAYGKGMRMEPERIRMLYFSLEAGKSAKAHWWSKARMPLREVGIGEGEKLLCCPVPEHYIGKRTWEEGRLTECLNGLIGQARCREYYLQPEVAKMVGVRERFPPEILLHHLLRQIPCMEYLCCIGWEEEQELLQELLEPYLPRINHVNAVSDSPCAYEAFSEYIYTEYGIPMAGMQNPGRNLGREGRTVILDGKRDYSIPWPVFPKGTVYVDFWSVDGKRKLLGEKRRDIKYLSVVKFLDTIVKSGYNTNAPSGRGNVFSNMP